MKLNEVSAGKSTLAFADYISELKKNGISPKIIGELYSVGVALIKQGAQFRINDESELVELVTPHFIVDLPYPFAKHLFNNRCQINIKDDAFTTLQEIGQLVGFDYLPVTTTTELAKINWAEAMPAFDAYRAARDRAVEAARKISEIV